MSIPLIIYLKNLNKKKLIGVEIGVYQGLGAKTILDMLPNINKLFLVDSYKCYIEKGLLTKVNYNRGNLLKAKNNLIKYKNRIEFIVKKSVDAINDIPDDVDFIYIDGSHKYRDVKKDIDLYYSKVKVGGVIGGHDINSPSIFITVVYFAIKKHLLTKLYFSKWDWWIQK